MRSTTRPPADVSSTLGMRGGRRPPAAVLAEGAFFAVGFRSDAFVLDAGSPCAGLACVGLSADAPDVALRPEGVAEEEPEDALDSRRPGVGLPGPPRLPEPCDAPDSAMA